MIPTNCSDFVDVTVSATLKFDYYIGFMFRPR
jgi:hypothetical protein